MATQPSAALALKEWQRADLLGLQSALDADAEQIETRRSVRKGEGL